MLGYSLIYRENGLFNVVKNETELENLLDSLTPLVKEYVKSTELKIERKDAKVVESATKAELLKKQEFAFGSALFLPNGVKFLNGLKKELSDFMIEQFDPLVIKTPDAYVCNDSILELQVLFGEEPYYTRDSEILRPAGDFGVFSMLAKNNSNYKLPVRFFEMVSCFRLEKAECINVLSRPRNFYMPDMHSFLEEKDILKELRRQEQIYINLVNSMNIDFIISVRTTETELLLIEDELKYLSDNLKKEIYVNVVPSRKRYWTTKLKFIYMDSEHNPLQLSTIQTDYDTAKLFEIKVNSEYPLIFHSSPGSVERWMYALIDSGNTKEGMFLPAKYFSKEKKGDKDKIFIPY